MTCYTSEVGRLGYQGPDCLEYHETQENVKRGDKGSRNGGKNLNDISELVEMVDSMYNGTPY